MALVKRLAVAGIFIPSVLYGIYHVQYLVVFLCVLAFFGMREFVLIRCCMLDGFRQKDSKNTSSREHAFPPRGSHSTLSLYSRCSFAALGPLIVFLFRNSSQLGQLKAMISWYSCAFCITSVACMLGYWPANVQLSERALRVEDFIALTLDAYGLLYTGGTLALATLIITTNPFLMVLTLGANWASDGAALLFGKQLAPRLKWGPLHRTLSPNKTLEGALGAILGSLLTSIFLKYAGAYFQLISSEISFFAIVLFGIVVGILSILGDLIESYMKRVAFVKDSGQFFSDHGGVLDRLDGLFFLFPIVFMLGEWMLNK